MCLTFLANNPNTWWGGILGGHHPRGHAEVCRDRRTCSITYCARGPLSPSLVETLSRGWRSLGFLAALAAAYSAPDSAPWFVGGAHVLLQTIYLAAAV